MITIEQTDSCRKALQTGLEGLVKTVGPIQIGSTAQFPFGWRKAAKGRTVWRILEEVINQNLEVHCTSYGISKFSSSDSEVSVYDSSARLDGISADVYLNVKAAVANSEPSKDDISKAKGLQEFFAADMNRQLFICTFEIVFATTMHLELTKCYVMPIAWLPDVYVNPSNNGNLQSSKYKNVATATRRTNEQFLAVLNDEIENAERKKSAKRTRML